MSGEIEEAKDIGSDDAALVKRWMREIDLSSGHEDKWRKRAAKIVERYRDEDRDQDKGSSRFSILYANVEVLKGVMYARKPVPDVRRRYADRDPLGREAATILQRALSYSIDVYDFDGLMGAIVEDVLLPGRGVARVKYKSQTEGEQVIYEAVECDYVEWEMFRISPAKRWSKVRWVAFGELLTREDLIKQFGDKGKLCKLDWAPKDKEEDKDELFKRALVWTVWDKSSKRVIVICKGYTQAPLMVLDDPLGLEGFFPCPKPVVSINTTNNMTPVPEFVQYQDQAIELDNITGRIDVLVGEMKRRGVYDASRPELNKIATAADNEFVPVENLVAMIEKGGITNLVMEMPIDGIAKVLLQLYEQRDRVKQIIYEVMGIGDIVRGASDANETLGAQQLKSKYANSRISPRQGAIAAFARDLLRIKAEIIAEKFSPQTLAQITGVELAMNDQEKQMLQMQAQMGSKPDPRIRKPTWDQVMGILRDDKLRSFKVDVETDSTIQPDADAEQKNRIEFLTAITAFAEKVGPMVQTGMVPMEIAKELLSFGVRAFKVSPQLEDALDQLGGDDDPQAKAQQAAQMQAQQQAQQQQIQAEQQAVQQKQQMDMQKQQQDIAVSEQKQQMDMQKATFDLQVAQEAHQIAMQKAQLELVATEAKARQATLAAETQEATKEGAEMSKQNESIVPQIAEMVQMVAESMQAMQQTLAQVVELSATAAAPRRSELQLDASGMPIGSISYPINQTAH